MLKAAIPTTTFPIAALSFDSIPVARLPYTPPIARKAMTRYPIVPVIIAVGIAMVKETQVNELYPPM